MSISVNLLPISNYIINRKFILVCYLSGNMAINVFPLHQEILTATVINKKFSKT